MKESLPSQGNRVIAQRPEHCTACSGFRTGARTLTICDDFRITR